MRWRFVARRLGILMASLFIASFVIFAALYLAPGNPVAALSGGRPLPPGSIRVLDQRYHLNEPFLAQYWYWLGNALHGNLGISITLRENVSTLIASRIWTTAGLVLYASVIIVVLGVGAGVASGLRPGRLDTSSLVVTAISAAIPAFVAAIGLKAALRSVPAQDYIYFLVSPKARAGLDGLPVVNYGDDADPANMLAQAVLPGGLLNYDNYSDPAITAALEQARSTANPDQRAALVAHAEKLAAQQLPWIPDVQPDTVLLLGKGLTGAISSSAYLYSPWANSLGRAG